MKNPFRNSTYLYIIKPLHTQVRMERRQSEEDRQAASTLEALFGNLSDLDSPDKTLDQLLWPSSMPTNDLLVTPTILAEPRLTIRIPNPSVEKEKSSASASRKRTRSTTMKKAPPSPRNGSTNSTASELEKPPSKASCRTHSSKDKSRSQLSKDKTRSNSSKTKIPETDSNLLSSSTLTTATTESISPPCSSLTCPPTTSTLSTVAMSEIPKPIITHAIPIKCVEKLFDTVIAPLIKVEGDSQLKDTLRCQFYRNLVLEIANIDITSRGSVITPQDLLEITFIAIETAGAVSLQ